MSQSPETIYCFGPFRYDSAQRVLYREGQPVPLVPKTADTLQALIETVPKRGYRFTAEVDNTPQANERIAPMGNRARRKWLLLTVVLLGLGALVWWQFYWPSRYRPQRQGSASLAVLLFKCPTPDLQRTSFAEALAEAVAQDVSKLGSVQVTSPSTVERYQRLMIPNAIVSRVLGLQVVVEGTVQTVGQHIRTSVRLTDVHSGKLIWAEAYAIPAADSGDAQVDIARKIAAQIGRCMSAR